MSAGIEGLAEQFTSSDGTEIKYLKLIGSVGGAFVALIVASVTEFLSVVFGLQVWAIDGAGGFLSDLLGELLGAPAEAQAAAWEEAAREAVMFGPLQPFILVGEALVLYALFQAFRDRGVLP